MFFFETDPNDGGTIRFPWIIFLSQCKSTYDFKFIGQPSPCPSFFLSDLWFKCTTMWGPQDSVQLVHITPMSLWFMVLITSYNYSYWGESKPTNITGGPHIARYPISSYFSYSPPPGAHHRGWRWCSSSHSPATPSWSTWGGWSYLGMNLINWYIC